MASSFASSSPPYPAPPAGGRLDAPPPPAGLLTTDGGSARDDARADPAALGFRVDARADDAGGLSGGKAGHGGVASTLTMLSAAERAALTELSKERQWAHVQKVEQLLLTGLSVAEADRRAYGLVPDDAAIPPGKRHAASAAQQQQL